METIFKCIRPLLYYVIWDKLMAINILKEVHKMTPSNLVEDKISIVHLIYSLPTSGEGRSLSFSK